jgi:hypothetical protein
LKYRGDRYRNHANPAIRLLTRIQETMPIRSVEHGILTCAILYLEGDLLPGWSVARWWPDEIQLAQMPEQVA